MSVGLFNTTKQMLMVQSTVAIRSTKIFALNASDECVSEWAYTGYITGLLMNEAVLFSMRSITGNENKEDDSKKLM